MLHLQLYIIPISKLKIPISKVVKYLDKNICTDQLLKYEYTRKLITIIINSNYVIIKNEINVVL